MNKSVERIMRKDAALFKRMIKHPTGKRDKQTAEQLFDNYYILERQANQALRECKSLKKHFRGSDILPGLFERCKKMCKKGKLPDDNLIIEFFDSEGLSGRETGLLPLALTCTLIDYAAEGIMMNSKNGSLQLAESVISMRKMSETDFDYISESLFSAESFLNEDEGYRLSDEISKSAYRKRLAFLSAQKNKTEKEIVVQAKEKSEKSGEHIGKYIFTASKNKKRGYFFLAFEAIMPFAVSFCLSVLFESVTVGLLTFLPLWEILRYPIENASMKGVHPKRFMRLSRDSDRVMNTHALITVSTLITSSDSVAEIEKNLEKIYLSNCIGNIKVCCLADLKAAYVPRKPEDKVFIKLLKEAVDRLNLKYDGGFILAVRPRVHSKTQNGFIGRERKRGAITELIRAINGNEKGFQVLHGDTDDLKKTKYLIALDADTELVFDSARELIAIAEHPLNRPKIKNGRVYEGYGILVPKAENRIKKFPTFFNMVMSGDAGITAYDSLTGERYQDLFGESIFCGKGLIDVETYYKLLDKSLPEECILSHDIVEGEYLRAGYVPDIQIAESFPETVQSFYKRLHRWVRGDWQNIIFILGKNPMNFISRYKMLDNLRRSATPATCIVVLVMSAFMSRYIGLCVALCAFCALFARYLYSAVVSLLNGGLSSVSRLYFSKRLPQALSAFAAAFLSVAFSAKEAVVCADAIAKSLWRVFISKRNLLEWTTAAQNEFGKKATGALIGCISSIIVSAILLIFGAESHRLIGLIILADIPLTLFASAEPKTKKSKVSENQRGELISYAASMWGFFNDLCGKENNFLPPDNIQFSPVRATANRTSPTNIGLMLASFLAARDFKFITTAELYMRLNLSFNSIEKLEKYKGNLFNWYDTRTLKAINPRFISSVDSGNFLCCLTALKEGLREYVSECPSLENIIARAEKIISNTELKPLYNERRKLFHIGINPDTGEKSNSYYDLFMSEARMTAYFAVARREVDKKHWGSMGRIVVGQGRYTGLASWTGTMFEYFMPELFIPSPRGSISEESLLFCLYSQRRKAGRLPFGISESGFYSFDGDLNYQYKAHGVSNLALKRDMTDETVISPYSSFLTLSKAAKISLNNLKKLKKIGMYGKYGFYEAVDYKRKINGESSVIHSYMAHHVGMSFIAADNLINSSCMQKRFMSDPCMKGAESLLYEKIPSNASVFKGIKAENIPNIRERVIEKRSVYENPSPFSPNVMLLSNGRMTTVIADNGCSVSMIDGADITVNSTESLLRPQGVFATLTVGGGIMHFFSATDRQKSALYKAEFFTDKAIHTSKKKYVLLKTETMLLKHRNCEIRKFTLENTGGKDALDGKMTVYFEPCLEKRKTFESHPMFSKLFLIDEWDDDSKCMIFSRSNSSESKCALCAGFIEDTELTYESSRERILRSPEGVFSLGEMTDFSQERGNPDCGCAFSVPISLKVGEKKTLSFAIVAEDDKEQALNTFLDIKNGKDRKKLSNNPFSADNAENRIAADIIRASLYPGLYGNPTELNEKSNFGKEDLWSFGISGELPMISVELDGENKTEGIIPYVKINKLLRSCGIKNDLVIIYEKDEDYTKPIGSAIKNILEKESCGLMLGVKGGVYTVEKSLHSYFELCSLWKSSSYYTKVGEKAKNSQPMPFKPLKFVSNIELRNASENGDSVKQYSFTNGRISIYKSPKSVDIPWNNVLANKSFGTMVSDKALGFTWALNSRENKLSPWYNDSAYDNRGEMLILKYNDVLYDLISIGTAEFTPYSAVWNCEIGNLNFRVEVSIPKKGTVKKCSVRIANRTNHEKSIDLMYFFLPVLGAEINGGVFYVSKNEKGFTVQNSFADIPGFCALQCSEKPDYFCLSKKDFFEGDFSSEYKNIPNDLCISIGKKIVIAANEETEIIFYLSWGASEKSALIMPEVADFERMLLKPLKIKTENEQLNLFFNSFLYSQIKQSRFYGKTGFYQCSGAYGFRDQLQDCLAFIDFEPEITLTHILRCSAVQFEEGDVLHWWHVILNKKQIIRGIRTKCSDDMLWLPYACIVYRKKTDCSDFLMLETPFVKGEVLKTAEKERYFTPERTNYKESLLNHCIRAVDRSLNFGKNGLPLIGSCDWNDGFSNIGETDAESVWLAMFQIIVLKGMSDICNEFGMSIKADEYLKISKKLENTVENIAWCGDRYARLISNEGKPLFIERDFIDILPQAFAVFAGLGKNGRADTALTTALKYLYDGKKIRLLCPSFDEDDYKSVGYIASYPEGIRENGGQYTHAAVWLAMALIENGRIDEGKMLLDSINPLSYYDEKNIAKNYRAEPYVLAGDVSFGNGIDNRAGWTHFTGSAAWYFRTIYDNIAIFGSIEEANKVKSESFTNNKMQKKSCKMKERQKNSGSKSVDRQGNL